jgi:hypothetical protein
VKRTIEIPNSKVASRHVKLYVRYGSGSPHYKATFPTLADANAAVATDKFKVGGSGVYVLQET